MVRLSETGRRIVRQAERYHLISVDAVHRLYYAERKRDSAKRALNRLVAQGSLNSYRPGRVAIYYPPDVKPKASQALWERFAVMTFCLLREPEKRLLSRSGSRR